MEKITFDHIFHCLYYIFISNVVDNGVERGCEDCTEYCQELILTWNVVLFRPHICENKWPIVYYDHNHVEETGRK